ncbi:MAG: YabP/YqfC family sporulation protein [Clostridia bacterium]|nr:YabP/YqfC family sporulation protein [Clostridia bacterium]MBR5746221.1 YabP/YqfC family sporulation protein [Clostridia bacterium]
MKLFAKLPDVKTPLFVELRGRDSVLCEGFRRITGYSCARIELASDTERLEINGSGLRLRHLSRGRIAVDGRIDGIGFL